MWGAALKLVPLLLQATRTTEKVGGAAKGVDKQNIAITIAKDLLAVEHPHDADVPLDVVAKPSVERTLRAAVDAIVAVQNAVDEAKRLREGQRSGMGTADARRSDAP